MPKSFFVILILLQISLYSFVYGETMTVNVCVYDNPPLLNIGKNNSVKGIGADILDYVADKENLKMNYVIST